MLLGVTSRVTNTKIGGRKIRSVDVATAKAKRGGRKALRQSTTRNVPLAKSKAGHTIGAARSYKVSVQKIISPRT